MEFRPKLEIIAVSDTHGTMKALSPLLKLKGDIFIHAGDFTYYGQQNHFLQFFEFLQKLNFRYKIVISGNHQIMLDKNNIEPAYKQKYLAEYPCKYSREQLVNQLKKRCIYLQHQAIQIQGYKIFGSPYTPMYCGSAFQYQIIHQKMLWNQIPKDIDLLITHGPPNGICDFTAKKKHAGSIHLQKISKDRAPKYHIFGHIHQARGMQKIGQTMYLNVAKSPTRIILQ